MFFKRNAELQCCVVRDKRRYILFVLWSWFLIWREELPYTRTMYIFIHTILNYIQTNMVFPSMGFTFLRIWVKILVTRFIQESTFSIIKKIIILVVIYIKFSAFKYFLTLSIIFPCYSKNSHTRDFPTIFEDKNKNINIYEYFYNFMLFIGTFHVIFVLNPLKNRHPCIAMEYNTFFIPF